MRRRKFRPRVGAAVRPPYRIPALDEIRAEPWNGLTVASTFSGCGGSSLGFRWAGFQSNYASEFIPAARDTYRANFPETFVDERDIRDVAGAEIVERYGHHGSLDVLEGSPPCASFSTAGKRERGWGEVSKYSDTKQRTDDLVFEFSRLVGEIRPRAFVMENVAGLVRGVAKPYYLELIHALREHGYRVECRLLDAAWLGVPQTRVRTVFVGFRDDLGIEPVFPSPLPYRYTIRDALGDLMVIADRRTSKHSDEDFVEINIDAPIATVTANGIASDVKYDYSVVSFEGYALEHEWRKLGPGEVSRKYLNLIRADLDRPSPTVTAAGGTSPGTASVTHPTEPRKFTIPELRRLCGFPDDFVLTGSWGQQWERLGRAVPPPMMRAVARTVADALLSVD